MEFIAAYWWLWMLATAGCIGLNIWRFISTTASIVGDGIEVVSLGVNATSTVLNEDKTTKDKGLELARTAVDRASSRIALKVKGFGLVIASFVCTWIFGILFVLSLVLNIIDYIKA